MISPLFGCSSDRVMMATPSNVDELLLNIKYSVEHNIFMLEESYSEEFLKNTTSGNKVSVKEFDVTRANISSRTYISDFPRMIEPIRMSKDWELPWVSLSIERKVERGKITLSSIDAIFQSKDASLSFEHITGIFGKNWTEDSKAENAKFMAVAREPFNPPAKPSLIIEYKFDDAEYKKTISMDFNDNKILWRATFTEERK